MNISSFTRQQLIQIINMLLSLIRVKTLHRIALAYLGQDASPSDLAPDELGCAESVSTIINKADPSFPVITGTYTLYDLLRNNPKFKQVTVPMPGTIVISPTGTSKLGRNAPFVGHVGICGERQTIMANDSYTGKWMSHYTLDTWRERWENEGKYPVLFYQFK